jgi:mannose/fructose/N-acetylgalactosamine-specific phosphotransferase system component IID
MSDVFAVTISTDKAAYNAGDTITATIAGNDVQTTTSTATTTVGPVVVPVVAANNAQSTVTISPFSVTTVTTVATPESVKIDTSRAITDPSGRKWTVSTNGLSITSTA